MASHDISWVLGAHVHFRDLDFTVMTEGELALAPTAVQPLHSTSLDVIAGTLEELQLHAPEAPCPRERPAPSFDYGRLERQLDVFLGP